MQKQCVWRKKVGKKGVKTERGEKWHQKDSDMMDAKGSDI